MKKMVYKRLVSLVLAVLMCLTAVFYSGCGNGVPNDGEASSSHENSDTTQPIAYNISYDLDGGIDGGNPVSYNGDTDVVISKMPVKPGYDFAGWTGSGLTEATKTVTVKKGTEGDLSFKATWVENGSDVIADGIDKIHFDADKDISAKEGDMPISVHDMLGDRGEGIYLLKTVYTAVEIDGKMDAAYTYGLHFEGDVLYNTSYYNDERKPASFDVYMIRSQDGYINIFIEVVDPEIVVNSYIFQKNSWHCDSVDLYYDYGNLGVNNNVYNFMADETGKFKRSMPKNTKIKLTDTGYVIETAMDNNGKPFTEYDMLGFSFFLNETRDWNATEQTYTKNLIKNHSVQNPVGTKYQSPSPALQDAVKITLASATGKVEVNEDIPQKTGDILTDTLNGSASVLVTYGEYATAQTIIAAQNIRNIILGNGGSAYICEEADVPADTVYDYEIVLGKTTREVSKALVDSIGYNEYAVSIGDKTIALAGWNEEAAYLAYDILFEIFEYKLTGGDSENVGTLYKGSLGHVPYNPALRLDGFDSITDVGEDAYLVYKLESTMEEYEAYCAQLDAAGYTLYTENEMSKVKVATYYNDTTVVNVQFANGGKRTMQNLTPDNSLRIVVEPLSNTALPMLEKPEDADAKVTVSSITQMYPHNLCLVVQLSNGHFIVIDSGNNGTQKVLSDFLREKAPDGKPVVEAWIFSHFHQDHIGGFVDYMGVSSLTRYITVKSVIYNFPQKQVTDTASSKDQQNLDLWYNKRLPAMREKGTTFYQARTGQKYYFGNAEIEILWTYEDIMPCNVFVDSTNRTDIGFTITIEGQKIMVTGDSAEDEFRMAASKYGSYLKSDILQLSHHGGGNGMGDHDLYKLVNAPVVFHPNPNKNGLGANEKWAVNNAQLVIRSGNYGIATLKLPFKVGDAFDYTGDPVEENGK